MSKADVTHSAGFSLDSSNHSSEPVSCEQPVRSPQWQVDFEAGDGGDPKTWGTFFRLYLTAIAGVTVLNASFASSAPVGILDVMSTELEMSSLVGVMTISLFVAGFAVGPFVWAPLSESYGRRPIFVIAFALCTGCQIGCALSRTSAQMLVFRFLGGCFSAAPLTNSGGLISDIWDVHHRGQAMSFYALAPFAGPSIGPIVSGYIEVSGTDWRWVYWVLAIFSGVLTVLLLFTVPETLKDRLLFVKARRLRVSTGNQEWFAPSERRDRSWRSRLRNVIFKPFVMLVLEPMLMAVTLYMSFLYGLVYLLFEAYPFVFMDLHGFNYGQEGLAFLAFFLGGALAVLIFMTVFEPRFQRHAQNLKPDPPIPERRLELATMAAWVLVVAMFWFAWTSYASIHWISPMLAGGAIGLGILGINISLFNYVVDTYAWAAASALAGPTVVRSLFGFGFPLFAGQMYEQLGPQWATSVLGFITVLLAPIPLLLMRYGSLLRARSRFVPAPKL